MADTRVKIVDIQVNITSAVQALAQYGQAIDEAKGKQKKLKQELKDGKSARSNIKSQCLIAEQRLRRIKTQPETLLIKYRDKSPWLRRKKAPSSS